MELFLLFHCCSHQFIDPSEQSGTEVRLMWTYESPHATAAPPTNHFNLACCSEKKDASVVHFGTIELSRESADWCLLDGGSE